MIKAVLLPTLLLSALLVAGCTSKPAPRGTDAAAPEATEKSTVEAPAAVPDTKTSIAAPSSAEDAPAVKPQTEEKAVVTDFIEPPPAAPTFVFAPDEPVPPAPPAPAPPAVNAPTASASPKPASPTPKPAAKAPAKSEPKPKAAPPVARPADDVIPPTPVREPVPKPAAGIPELPTRAAPPAVEEEISYSRTVRATVGQLVEVPFRGAGWVFLGELGSRKGLPYDSRRLDADGQSFVFRAEAVGTYSLKFFRQDFIADYIVNDHVRVIVGEAAGGSAMGGFTVPVDRGRVVAEPRWPQTAAPASTTPATPAASATAPLIPSAAAPATTSATSTTIPPAAASQAAPVAPAPTSMATVSAATPAAPTAAPPNPAASMAPAATLAAPTATTPAPTARAAIAALPSDAGSDAYLAIVKAEADAGRPAGALEALDLFRERFPAGSDEAWWLYGRLLEANGPTKDVKAALGFYKRLIAEYPQSSRYDEARKRIAYLERYYFEIR